MSLLQDLNVLFIDLSLQGMKLTEIIANNLKALHTSLGMNETTFAKHCDIHQKTYNRIVNCESKPRLDILEQIAERNGLQVWQLLVDGFQPNNPPVIRYASDREKEMYERIKLAAQEIAKYQQ